MGLKETIQRFFGFGKVNKQTLASSGTLEKEFGVCPAASQEMEDNASLWHAMYRNEPPWATHEVRPLGLPESICRELSRNALTEFEMTVSGGARADYINQQMNAVKARLSAHLEMGLCLGGVTFKPFPYRDRILVEAFTTDFTPTHFSDDGKCIGGVFKSRPVRSGKEWYVKLEYHDFQTQENGAEIYIVENKAFRSNRDGGIGARVDLSVVPEWAQLSEHEEIEGLEGPLFSYFKTPMPNTIDPASPIGVSVCSGAIKDRIREADEQWERIFWEYKSGERKLITDNESLNVGQAYDRLFLKGSFTSTGDLFEQFSPEFRNASLYEGLQYILKIIEFNVGLAFGTISDPQSVNKTATEEIMTKHRQYITEDDIQKALEPALEGIVYAIDAWCSLLGLAPAGEYKTAYSWGDGVLDDPDTRRQDMAMDMQRVAAGLMTDIAFVMKYDRVDEETARKMLPRMADMTQAETQDEVE